MRTPSVQGFFDGTDWYSEFEEDETVVVVPVSASVIVSESSLVVVANMTIPPDLIVVVPGRTCG